MSAKTLSASDLLVSFLIRRDPAGLRLASGPRQPRPISRSHALSDKELCNLKSLPHMVTCVDVPDGLQQVASAKCEIDALIQLNQALQERVARLNDALARTSRYAFHDELTGLPNRRLLKDHFRQAVARAIRTNCEIVLVFIDLNEFKGVNEEFGHVAGDGLLQQVAGRLKSCLRITDTACRFGGDEFVLLLPDISARQQATAPIERIVAELAIPYAIDKSRIRVPASVGMAIYPQDGTNYCELLTLADFTMFSKKPSGAPAESLSAHAHLPGITRSTIR